MKNTEKTMDQIVGLCKGRGFVYPGSEIYGGLSNTWDYGPLGVELKNNVKRAWWKKFVQESPHNVGLDSAILMNPQVWVASGHVGGFSDPLMDCKDCKTRHRADKLIEDYLTAMTPDGWIYEQMMEQLHRGKRHRLPELRQHATLPISAQFNLMFKTFQGVTEDAKIGDLPAPGNGPGHFRQLQKRAAHHPQKAALWHRPDRQELSATRSRRATSPSAPGNLSRWNWNSSASPAQSWSGSTIGKTTAKNSWRAWV